MTYEKIMELRVKDVFNRAGEVELTSVAFFVAAYVAYRVIVSHPTKHSTE